MVSYAQGAFGVATAPVFEVGEVQEIAAGVGDADLGHFSRDFMHSPRLPRNLALRDAGAVAPLGRNASGEHRVFKGAKPKIPASRGVYCMYLHCP